MLPKSLWRGDTVLKSAFVEHVRREFGKARVHAILDLKPDRTVPKDDEAFEQRLSEAGTSGFLVHDHGAELLGEFYASAG